MHRLTDGRGKCKAILRLAIPVLYALRRLVKRTDCEVCNHKNEVTDAAMNISLEASGEKG